MLPTRVRIVAPRNVAYVKACVEDCNKRGEIVVSDGADFIIFYEDLGYTPEMLKVLRETEPYPIPNRRHHRKMGGEWAPIPFYHRYPNACPDCGNTGYITVGEYGTSEKCTRCNFASQGVAEQLPLPGPAFQKPEAGKLLDEIELEAMGRKDDKGKAPWHLLPWKQLEEVVGVLAFGAKEYGEGNWKVVTKAEDRYFSALIRHLNAYRNGERKDPKSGRTHLAHVVCNALFLAWFDSDREV